MQDASERKRRAASQALAKTFRENLRTFALITNTLAKDKEISDRWRGFKDIADARHLRTASSPRWSMRWCRRCATPIRGSRIATTR
jgi:oligoendopeptidase F